MKTLNVKKHTKKEIEEKWNVPLPYHWPDSLFMRCNAKGKVNWEVAPVFRPEELIERGKYKVHE